MLVASCSVFISFPRTVTRDPSSFLHPSGVQRCFRRPPIPSSATMRFSLLASLLALSCCSAAKAPRHRDYDLYDYYAVHIDPSVAPEDVASSLGLELDGQVAILQDHYVLRSTKHSGNLVKDAVQKHKRRKRKRELGYADAVLDSILLHQKQELRAPMEKRGALRPPPSQVRQYPPSPPFMPIAPTSLDGPGFQKAAEIAGQLNITDPIFHEQWHLYNPIQTGHDLNVTGVWLQGITGKNATVCIVDDGLDFDSLDLKDNYFPGGSHDYNDQGPDPRPRLADDRHGTRCAGEVAAVRNNVCGVGVAYDARIAGIRILSKPISDVDEADALTFAFQENDIYSCSWGPPDDGMEMGQPGIMIKRSMIRATQEGRHGLGTIYVFAAGNGAAAGDNCNFDGYTNSIYSVTVGAVDRLGLHPYYSEKCSAQLVVTYSSGSGDSIHTTDVGENMCYSNHGGTSAAGPLAAGIFALALEANPNLTWRDIQWLSVLTAVPIQPVTRQFDAVDSEYQTTALGRNFSHQFGYGKLDAWGFVEKAKDFEPVKPQAWYFSAWQHIRAPVPQGTTGLKHSVEITEEALRSSNLERVEHVTVTMNVNHTRRGDLSVELRSPTGIISHLSTTRARDTSTEGYKDWTFMSVAHWGESGVGSWDIIVKDTVVNEFNGTLIDWKLNLFGECIDPEIQELLPLPTSHDDDDHDVEEGEATHTEVDPGPTETPAGNPDDHLHRPINYKPTGGEGVGGLAPTLTEPFEAPVQATYQPTFAPDSFLPSPFPTFGFSKNTQIWIYGAAVLIIIFFLCLAVYFWMARRKRLRNLARDNYEFEVLDDDDEEADGIANGRAGPRRGKRRAKELYDAFAGESDEDDFFSDDEEGRDRYRDGAPLSEKGLSSDEGEADERRGLK